MKETRQREAIHATLLNAGRPLSVNEILVSAHRRVIGLGVATVYRNLRNLQLEGQITQVQLPGEPPRWEISADHHHHFLCNTCDKLFEINDCPEDLKRILPEGYTLEEHDILLRGQCSACSGSSKLPTNRT